MAEKILFVDDELRLLTGIYRQLRKDFQVETAVGGELGLESLAAKGPYAVVVSDMRMPGMDGVQFLKHVRDRSPHSVRIMLTGNADQETATHAINDGNVFRFLNKPCNTEDLTAALRAALEHHRLVIAEREVLEKTLQGTIRVLTEVLSMTDAFALGRAATVRDLVRTLAVELGFESAWEVEAAAMLAPLGLMSLPSEVTAKSRTRESLSAEEQAMIARVPEVGFHLIENIPRLEHVAQIVRYHCKHFDGSGAPKDAVAGEEIPLGARMIRLLSDLVELEAQSIPRSTAVKLLEQRTGHYDPKLLALLRRSDSTWSKDASPDRGAPMAVTLAGLHVGLRLQSDIYSNDGRLMISSGHVVTQVLLAKIRNYARLFGVKEPILVERPRGLE